MRMVNKRGVNLGNHNWEWHWGEQWNHKQDPEEAPLMFSQEVILMANLMTIVWGRQQGRVSMMFDYVEVVRDLHQQSHLFLKMGLSQPPWWQVKW